MAKTARKKLKGNVANSDVNSECAIIQNYTNSQRKNAGESRAEKRKQKDKIKASHPGKELQVNKKQLKHSEQINEKEMPFAEGQKPNKSHLSSDTVSSEDVPQHSLQNRKKSKKRKFGCEANADESLSSSSSGLNSKKKNKKLKLTVDNTAKVEMDEQQKFEVCLDNNAESGKKSACSSMDAERTKKFSTQKQSVVSKSKMKLNKSDEESSLETKQTQQADSTAKFHALEYLRRWKHQRSEWSFQKVRQVWLLQNMYDEAKVNGKDFAILVEYLEDLAGKARQATIEQAEKIMREAEDDESSPPKVSDEQLDRLRQVLQILS